MLIRFKFVKINSLFLENALIAEFMNKTISLPTMQFDQDLFLDDDCSLKIETLLLDGNRGIHIPKIFLDNYGHLFDLSNVDQEDLESIRNGADDEYYWQAWESVLRNATLKEDSSRFLAQDDDLWLVSINS